MDTRHGSSTTAGAFSAATPSASRALAFSKMETLVREMQDKETGIPIRMQKVFLTTIPSSFMGYDLIEWLLERLDMDDSGECSHILKQSTVEAIHLGNLLCQYGYFFPVGETRSLMIKDDSSLYRFQTPYYWPSQNHTADSTDYAIYLTKRLARNKQKHGLEDYETDSYNKLKKNLQHKWDFIVMQADEQVKIAKDRKKGDKIVTDSQERAYWRVNRPPPGYNNILENAPVPDRGNIANRVRKKTLEERRRDVGFFKNQIERTRMKVSAAVEGLITYAESHWEYDCIIVPPLPANPWIGDEDSYWVINKELVDIATEKRLRRWALTFSELIADPQGIVEFTHYLRKEYCHENIRFWQAVNDLRYGNTGEIGEKVTSIYDEFLKPGAPCEINIDGKTMEITQQLMKNPTRYTYDLAAEHVYMLLLKKDCYPRFLRSEHYKNLLANPALPTKKRLQDRFLIFSMAKGQERKKASTTTAPNNASLQAQTPQPLKRHGSDEQAVGGMGMCGDLEGLSSSMPLQPRIDCDPPYSYIEKAFAQASTGDDKNKKTTEELVNANVCPWETMQPAPLRTQSEQPRISSQETEQHQQELHKQQASKIQQSTKQEIQKMQICKYPLPSVPYGFVPKDHLVYPKIRPDRSKSMDVGPISDHRQPLGASQHPGTVNVRSSLCTSPLKESSEGSQKNEKSRSVDVDIYPWDYQSQPKKEVHVTSLTPSTTYLVSDRRASEGCRILAEKKAGFQPNLPEGGREIEPSDLCPVSSKEPEISIDEIKKMGDICEKPETIGGSAISEKSTKVIISVQQSLAFQSEMKECPPSPSSSCSNPSPGKPGQFNIDYTVRSGHKSEHFVMPSSSQSPLSSPTPQSFAIAQQPPMKISTAAAFTSTTSTSTTTMAISLEQIKGTTSQHTQLHHRYHQEIEEHRQSLRKEKSSTSQLRHGNSEAKCSTPSYSSKDETCDPSTPTKGVNVVAPWEDEEEEVQKTSDICPWEDEESCKVDTPFVKTYATLGYL